MLQSDIFSPVAFIPGLWQIFSMHATPVAGVSVSESPHVVLISKLDYADDATVNDEDTGTVFDSNF